MTQNPGQWGPQGGYPPQQPPGGYPPQQRARGGYPAASSRPGDTRRTTAGPSPATARRVATTRRVVTPPQGGYPPQGQPPGLPAAGPGSSAGSNLPGGGYPAAGRPAPAKKSPALIIGIVVAAVVLLAAIGGIIMVLARRWRPAAAGVDHPQPAGPPDGTADPEPHRASPPTGPTTEGPTTATPDRDHDRRAVTRSTWVTASRWRRPPAGRSRRPARVWLSCRTARASSSAR